MWTCRNLLLTSWIMLFSVPVWAMEHYTDSLQSETGKAIGGASVAVYLTGTSTLATIYSDNGVTAKANPFTTNALDGTFGFYAANGNYDIVFSHAEYTFDSLHTKRISLFDLSDFSGNINSGATFPSDPATNTIFVLTSAATAGSCVEGGGENASLCRWDGDDWVALGGGGGETGWPTVSTTKEMTWANSLANAVRLGDGVTPICIFTDVTIGPVIKPCTDANTRTHIWTNFTWGIRDHGGDADMFVVDPDAATKKAMYAFQSGYYPLKSFYLPAGYFSTDGTQCAAPAEATPVASGAKLFTILCADNDSSRMHATFDMPDDYDGGTIQLKSVVVQTAADTNVIEFQARAQCKGDTETLVAISSFGTEVVWTDTMTGSGAVNKATSGAITPSGTCAAGDLISLSIDIGATNTTTAMATAHILGFKVIYSSTSLSH